MSSRGKSVIDLGTDTDGITFKWTGSDDHITAAGELEINMWNSYDERSWVTLQAADALELAQWINEQLGRD